MCRFPGILLAVSLLNPSFLQANSSDVDLATQKLLAAGAAGFSMALINENGVYWSDAHGFADLARQRPMSIDTVMNIASISKTVVGASLMMLVEQGKLDLDRDVNDYLPFGVTHPDYPGLPITARQLLTHCSAIIDQEEIYFSEVVYFPGADNPISLGDFLQAYLSPTGEYYAPANFADYAPGSRRQYSNIAFGLAGYLVEVLSGEPLNRFSAERLFKPLEMTASGWMLSEIETSQHAQLYELNGDTITLVPWYGLATWPDGGVRTNVHDLSRFISAMIGGGQLGAVRVMSADSVAAMLQPQFVAGQVLAGVEEAKSEQQALGWAYRTGKAGKTVLGHSGGDPGVSTHAWFYPDAGVGAVLLVNTSAESNAYNEAVFGMMRTLLNAALKGR
jgi:CubicO group peptidase (beta-lactamase class C family)